MITRPGLINVDFMNVKAIMENAGNAMMAIGQGKGETKAADAIHQALHMPLLDLPSLADAKGVLIHFTGGDDLSLYEVSQAGEQLRKAAPEADIVFGASVDPSMAGRTQVILVATGFSQIGLPAPVKPVAAEATPPQPEPKPAAHPANLAVQLFSRVVNPEPEVGVEPEEQPAYAANEAGGVNPNNLDIPAFLRRRRTIRDIS
jgi:cell division protein FtsZ